ncbi:PREDICTED: gamma-aminobutyric acid type B receptor subunit 2-like [Amphimedon queenslandica]|uniref:G-protein coupled receptors family 3 profile domain-containing protein n=1 Tax=Amphimedon queenslandica TaxID=400682 RepID=A0A1X7VVJ8_AMPQE|nr:PREDICTED: gamma-aminobutyric acid type B receptor subunit 2-like [Amphimedon queenslandica]|eukprot:XP_019863258.1 PREDICTED: gamma-aminobutyric acid type B receptor subunit 2-like [Amphimedon queenslandica]
MLHLFYSLFISSLFLSSSSGQGVYGDHFNSSSSGDTPIESGSGSDSPATTTMPPTISTAIPPPTPPPWFPQDCPCPYGKHLVYLVQPSPCYYEHERNSSSVLSLTSPRACDIHTYTGMIAADYNFVYNSQPGAPGLTLLNTFCFEPRSYSVITWYPNGKEDLPTMVRNLYYHYKAGNPLHGVIAPHDQKLSERINYVVGKNIKRLVMSYSTPGLLQNRTVYPYQYTTSPSEIFLNKVRLQVLYDFNWRRVAIVSTDDAFSSEAAEQLFSISRDNTSMDINFPGSFLRDPTAIFEQLKEDDYRIFVGFFPLKESRYIICKAMRMGLTTSQHVWILPGIYDYMWWHDCTCDNNDKFCSCNDCTEEEMKSAIQGMLFIDASNLQITNVTETQDQIHWFHELFNFTRDFFIFPSIVNITEEDRQYLIHSRGTNAYDAIGLFYSTWHAAAQRLLSSTNDVTAICDSMSKPIRDSNDQLDLLSKTMVDILETHVFCGVSGYYNYKGKNNNDEFGQAKVTQFQDDHEYTIGIYRNYEFSPDEVYCPRNKLVELNESRITFSPSSLFFSNLTNFNFRQKNFGSSGPYRWKNKNGSFFYNCYTAPTDGACHDESCLCFNQIEESGISLSLFIMLIGIITSVLLILFNFHNRNNKHIKASSPKFTLFIIIGALVMYVSILFLALSFSGNFIIKSESSRKIALPVFCELDKWLSSLGMIITLSAMLVRNWRLHKIFYNPKIANRSYLSDKILIPMMLLLIAPVCLLLIIWSSTDAYKYKEMYEAFNCTDIIVDDSITTELVTYTCSSSPQWRGLLVMYNLLLSCGLIFFSYQNAKIRTHFSQEGEFAARAVFVVFLFVIPAFAIDLLLILTSTNSLGLFWIRLLLAASFPSVVLGGLFVPKIIFMMRDKRELEKLKQRQTLSFSYEGKIKEIDHLKSVLSKRESIIALLQKRGSLRNESSPLSMVTTTSSVFSPSSFPSDFLSFIPE